MPTGIPLTDDAVHRAIWAIADRRGVVKLDQKKLAETFGVTKFTMSRKIKAMLEAERLRPITNKGNARGKFVVTDPDEFSSKNWFDEGDD